MIWEKNWKKYLKNQMGKQGDNCIFGCYQWSDTEEVIREFSKVERMGCKIELGIEERLGEPELHSENIRIFLPNKTKSYPVLIYILTNWPRTTWSKYIDRDKILEMEWS